ncbi:MAG TPA: DUF1080 domain-containing protein [Fibrobacteria bacterium]|nr:DUF1080 domain-containing protein [Fibrobacteria bacterium]
MKYLSISAVTLCATLALSWGQTPDNTLSECEKQEGFKPLFDGTTGESFRSNWVDYKQEANPTAAGSLSSSWKYDAATHAIISEASQPDIRSKITYRDMDFRMTYRNSANQGIFYRFLTTAKYAYETGVEVAIQDGSEAPKKVAGAAYDMFAPSSNKYNVFSSGLWNDLRIVVKGDSVEHWMNGVKIVSFRYGSPAWWAAYDLPACKWRTVNTFCMKVPGSRDPSSVPIPEGFIGFQGTHGGAWYIKNFRINSNSATVNFGPVKTNCSTGIPQRAQSPGRAAGSYSVIRSGRVATLKLNDIKADEVRVLTLEGHLLLRLPVDNAGAASLAGWEKPGLYVIQAVAQGRSVLSGKIVLP